MDGRRRQRRTAAAAQPVAVSAARTEARPEGVVDRLHRLSLAVAEDLLAGELAAGHRDLPVEHDVPGDEREDRPPERSRRRGTHSPVNFTTIAVTSSYWAAPREKFMTPSMTLSRIAVASSV